ncbi:MAG: DoxX family protein [Thiotrichales bacterium]
MNIKTIATPIRNLFNGLDDIGAWVAPLGLRFVLAYEFWEAGVEKLRGENWFESIRDQFPFPFNLLPPDWSWQMATWTELLAPLALVLGLGTRFASLALIILTIVAWVSVHAGSGYNVCDNGFKLPLIYLVMFLPLLLTGPGKLSLDHWLSKYFSR